MVGCSHAGAVGWARGRILVAVGWGLPDTAPVSSTIDQTDTMRCWVPHADKASTLREMLHGGRANGASHG